VSSGGQFLVSLDTGSERTRWVRFGQTRLVANAPRPAGAWGAPGDDRSFATAALRSWSTGVFIGVVARFAWPSGA